MRATLLYLRPALIYALMLWVTVGIGLGLAHLTRRPAASVVLITVDSLRADHLGIYGYERETSPAIDAIAERGIVFERAYTVDTLSGPSHSSIFTSLYPLTHGVVYNGHKLPEKLTTLAEMFRDSGYRTAAFVSDWLLGAQLNYDQGFESFAVNQVQSRTRGQKSIAVEGRSYRLATAWLKNRRDTPFFLWLHCQQPHFSYNPQPPWDSAFVSGIPADYPYRRFETMRDAHRAGALAEQDRLRVKALYDGEIALTDHLLRPLFEEIERHEQPVWIVFTSDHGDLFFEGEPPRIGHGGGHYYEGAMRVPLIVVPPPGQSKPGARSEALISSIDILPTLAAISGLRAPKKIEGRSFLDAIEGRTEGARDRVHAMYVRDTEHPTLALRTERWKFIRRDDRGTSELYDLSVDPRETIDLSATETDTVSRMSRELDDWYVGLDSAGSESESELSEEIRELLRQGGYLDEDD